MVGRKKTLPFFPLLFFFLIFPAGASSQTPPAVEIQTPQEPVRMRADHITYDRAADIYTAEGAVEIWQGQRKLMADRVIFHARTNDAEAAGNVILVQKEDVLRAERMTINLETHLGIIVHGSLFIKEQHFYLRGEEIERLGENTYRIREGNFTTCDGDSPAWRFRGEEALITLEEYATVHGATFEVKKVPILYSPYFVFPVKTQRQSGFLIPVLGYSNTAGALLHAAYFWAIARNMDATIYLDVGTAQGIGEGVEYRYIRRKGSEGIFYGHHIRETESYRQSRTEQLGRPADRWIINLQHEEYFSETFFAKARLREFSDRLYLQDYGLTFGERTSEQSYSLVSVTKDWERFSLFGEGRHTTDLRQEDPTTLQQYPIVNFVGVRQPIPGSPLYYSLTSAYANFLRDQGQKGQRVDFYPRLALPLRAANVEITPEIGGRETLVWAYNGEEERRSFELWDFKTTAATEFYRLFDTGWANLPKIKHLIRPEVSYGYIPDRNQQQIPFFGPFYEVPTPKTNGLTYGVTQRFIGKVADGPETTSRYHEFVYLKVSQSYDFFEANRELGAGSEPRRPFGTINLDLRIRSLKYITLENFTSYDPNRNRLLTAYSRMAVADRRGDTLTLEHYWVEGSQNQIFGLVKARVTNALDLSYGQLYSALDKQTLWTVYGATYRHQCWSLDVSYSERPSVSGAPAEKKYLFMFNLTGVTSLGRR